MKTTKTVVATYGVKYEMFALEYFDDAVKEWLSAAGGWQDDFSIPGVFKDVRSAKSVAKQLARVTNKVVRVVKEEM